jgi:hypothetical protein
MRLQPSKLLKARHYTFHSARWLAGFSGVQRLSGPGQPPVEPNGFEGVFQIASLHPHYQFADALPDAITNCTNRSPYPTLHLLREDSIDRAVKAFPHAEAIFETNMRTMERLGPVGWAALDVGASAGRGKLPP